MQWYTHGVEKGWIITTFVGHGISAETSSLQVLSRDELDLAQEMRTILRLFSDSTKLFVKKCPCFYRDLPSPPVMEMFDVYIDVRNDLA